MDYDRMLREVAAENEVAQRTALADEARRFLRELAPDSQEALWFEALAEGYASRLEAAIAYVRDVKRP